MRRSPAASGAIHPCHSEIELSSGVVLVGDAVLSLCDHAPRRRRDRFVAMILCGATPWHAKCFQCGVSLAECPEMAADPRAVPRGWGDGPGVLPNGLRRVRDACR
jgi:hypothetical protein